MNFKYLSRICIISAVSLTANDLLAEQPNFVILYSDDAGYADFGFQPDCAQEMKNLTPFIDSIAKDGVRFSNAYMSGAVCSPSRAGLMTGRYQQRFGYDNNLPPGTQSGLDLNQTFGAKRLREFGYKTGLIGKWHLGYPAEFHPNQRGFDHFYGLLQGSRSYFPINNVSPHRVILNNTTPTEEGGYVTDRFGDAACHFIIENKDSPFYLFVSFTAPHGPNQPKESDKHRTKHLEKKKRALYAGLIVSLDDNVGKILQCLKDQGLEENTLVIFTNDNGGQILTGAVNTPLRGRKGMMFEGGIRVPWAIRWPGKTTAGSVIDDPVIALDILPTLVEASGNKVEPSWKLDGSSLYRRLIGEVDQLPERSLFWRKGGSKGDRAMRQSKWKVVDLRSKATAPQLFDLDADISEANDLASQQPERLETMLSKLTTWEAEMKEPLWGKGAPGNPVQGNKKKK